MGSRAELRGIYQLREPRWARGALSRRLPLTFIAVSSVPAFLTLALAGLMTGSVGTAARLTDR